MTAARKGWRERVEPGVYRAHRVTCPRTTDRRPGGRCACPYELKVPGSAPGATRTVTHPGPIGDARAERRALMAAGRPEPVEEPADVLTLETFFAEYMRAVERTLTPATIYNYDECFRLRISPALGHLPLTAITNQRVRGFVNELAATAPSARTVQRTMTALRACMRMAVEWGRVPVNPTVGIRDTRIRVDADRGRHAGHVERRVLDAEELRGLYAACVPRVAGMVRVAAECGLRRGELIGLHWGDLDLQGRILHVRRSVWHERSGGRRPIEKPTKGRETRVLPIGDRLAEALADWYAVSVVEGGADAAGYVWPGRNGGATAADTPTQAVERACVRAGLVDADGKPVVTLHGLRHGCGSLMLTNGVPLIVVSRFLGHATVQVTAERYSHLVGRDDAMKNAVKVMQAVLHPSEDAPEATGTVEDTVEETGGAPENLMV